MVLLSIISSAFEIDGRGKIFKSCNFSAKASKRLTERVFLYRLVVFCPAPKNSSRRRAERRYCRLIRLKPVGTAPEVHYLGTPAIRYSRPNFSGAWNVLELIVGCQTTSVRFGGGPWLPKQN